MEIASLVCVHGQVGWRAHIMPVVYVGRENHTTSQGLSDLLDRSTTPSRRKAQPQARRFRGESGHQRRMSVPCSFSRARLRSKSKRLAPLKTREDRCMKKSGFDANAVPVKNNSETDTFAEKEEKGLRCPTLLVLILHSSEKTH